MNASARKRRIDNPEKARTRDRKYRTENLEKARKRDRDRYRKKYNSDVSELEFLARKQRRLEIAALQPIEREQLRREKNRQTYHRYKNLEKRRSRDQNRPEKVLKRQERCLQRVVKCAAKGLRRLEGLEIQRLKNIESAQRWKLIERIRERIRQALKGNQKSARTVELLGCSVAEAWIHLEKQFKPGMTRENHGSYWHIDHIRPCASFDLSQPEQQRQCFHFTNLQPLTIEEHKLKHATQARYDEKS